MSKTFKNATNSGTEVYVGEGINADSVQLIIRNVGSGIGKAGIYLNSSDIPALALAILESAGWPEDDPRSATKQIMMWLGDVVRTVERITAEAEAQAKLEAEALELRNAYHKGIGYPSKDWSHLNDEQKEVWLAVARKAREMRAEK